MTNLYDSSNLLLFISVLLALRHQGALLLAWLNFNPSMDKLLHILLSVGPFQSSTVETINNSIPDFTVQVITYPCWD